MFPKMLEEAIKLAQDSNGKKKKGFNLAAVGVRADGAKVSSVNLPNTNKHVRAHAEGRIVRKLDAGAVVYVARTKKDGSVGMSRPCKLCQGVLKARGIAVVIYTIDDSSWGSMDLETGEEKIRS